ncbi:uncharacterized protein LY79DRAFT_564418 [Colletotrichum navitas]|uniref:Uncharacterized protein n=1 Tax=Colletotrichum navitas TaxID=681940 RepID=A0AAD8PSG1_9PEZI|nr:uncharacterized protein LY79DRAFT_564418 [Colletotrichum navitas]KAK1579402.1 hypothetical protein LY79DRAFT_564418 [Colletotrichum navitas]
MTIVTFISQALLLLTRTLEGRERERVLQRAPPHSHFFSLSSFVKVWPPSCRRVARLVGPILPLPPPLLLSGGKVGDGSWWPSLGLFLDSHEEGRGRRGRRGRCRGSVEVLVGWVEVAGQCNGVLSVHVVGCWYVVTLARSSMLDNCDDTKA